MCHSVHSGGGSLYDVTSYLAARFHIPSRGLCLWFHVPSGGLYPGGHCPGGHCPGGLCLGVSAQGISIQGSLSRGVSGWGVSVRESLSGRPPRRLSLIYNTLAQYYMYLKSNVLVVQVDLFRCLQIYFLIDLHCKTSIRNLLNPRKCPHFLWSFTVYPPPATTTVTMTVIV